MAAASISWTTPKPYWRISLPVISRPDVLPAS